MRSVMRRSRGILDSFQTSATGFTHMSQHCTDLSVPGAVQFCVCTICEAAATGTSLHTVDTPMYDFVPVETCRHLYIRFADETVNMAPQALFNREMHQPQTSTAHLALHTLICECPFQLYAAKSLHAQHATQRGRRMLATGMSSDI